MMPTRFYLTRSQRSRAYYFPRRVIASDAEVDALR